MACRYIRKIQTTRAMADVGRDRCNRIGRHVAHVPFTASSTGIGFAAPVVRVDPVVMRSASLTPIPKAWSLTLAPESEAGFARSGLAQEFEPAWLEIGACSSPSRST